MKDAREQKGRARCERCGACCEKGGPALHGEDLALWKKGILPPSALMTLRKGEVARDDVAETLAPLSGEIVKVKSAPGKTACVFYRGKKKGCGIYADRPLECRLLSCRDTAAIAAAYDRDRLRRADLIGSDAKLAPLVAAHEERCSLLKVARMAAELSGPGGEAAASALLDLLQYDHFMRPFLAQKAGIRAEDMDFLFGRPLSEAIAGFGLAVRREGNRFTLCPWYDLT